MVLQQINAEIAWNIVTSLGIIIAITGQIIGWVQISNKNKQKYASKEYVKQESRAMDLRVTSLEKQLEDHEKVNTREHDRMEKMFETINEKLDRLIERQNKKAS